MLDPCSTTMLQLLLQDPFFSFLRQGLIVQPRLVSDAEIHLPLSAQMLELKGTMAAILWILKNLLMYLRISEDTYVNNKGLPSRVVFAL